jgi:FtsH-binding integral membrane protein
MHHKLYSKTSQKDINAMLKLYTALLIVSVILIVVMNGLSYFFLSSDLQLKPSIGLLIVIAWSGINVDYLKKIK